MSASAFELVHQLTGLKAGSLALVAGVACSSVLEAGWGYLFFSGMGRPDEISGLTAH